MKRTAILVALATLSVAFAGCTSGGDGSDSSQKDGEDGAGPIDLGNKGAINGLVVDDNFRPVQLKEEWGASGPGEFQDLGFVLILETGQRFETNENGEFQAVPLDPGTYTLRVAADNHEAIEQKVQVVAGEFTEATLEARRTFSTGGTVLSQEQVIFIACSGSFVLVQAASIPGGCGDTSGDSERFDFWSDFTSLKDDVRGIVTEMRASQNGYYGVSIRVIEDWCEATFNQCYYSESRVANDMYVHNVLYPGLQYVSKGEYLEEGQGGYCKVAEDQCRTYGFSMDYRIQTALFPEPATRQLTDPVSEATRAAWEDVFVDGYTPSAGFILGTKAQFLQTVFLYELPDAGIEDHCALCIDADIPE